MLNEIVDKLSRYLETGHDFNLYGLRGASRPLITALMQKKANRPVMVVTSSFENAEQWLDDLKFFSHQGGIHFFPHWDTLPYDNFSPHKEIVSSRFQTLKALSEGTCRILVTTPNALMQRIMPKELFDQYCLRWRVGTKIKLQDACVQLKQAGYTQVDRVEERGEFSTHGNIVDLFGLNYDFPARIEWAADELAEIKPFDIQDQLTGERRLEVLDLVPGHEVLLTETTLTRARNELILFRDQVSHDLFRQVDEFLVRGDYFPGIESMMPLFYRKPAEMFEYLPINTMVVLDDETQILEKAKHLFDEIFMEYELCRQQGNFGFTPETCFLDHNDLKSSINKNHVIRLEEGSRPARKNLFGQEFNFISNASLRNQPSTPHTDPHSTVVNLLTKLRQWQQEGAHLVFTARTQTAADHFHELLSDFQFETQVVESQTIQEESLLHWLEKEVSRKSGDEAHPTPILTGKLTHGCHAVDDQGRVTMAILTEEEIFGEKSRGRRMKHSKANQFMGTLDDLHEGDYVVHLEYGIGHYQGLKRINVGESHNEFMVITYARNEKVYVPVDKFHMVQKYINAEGSAPKLNKLGDKAWKKARTKAQKAVEDIAQDLVEIYAKRKAKKGIQYSKDNALMQEFELAFPYEETEDQLTAINEVKENMESSMPMDRLVCGDVGFGKTEVAMRAAFKAVLDKKQVGVLVPTTILAQQHCVSFQKRFEGMPVNIDVISRFRSQTEQRHIAKDLANGKIDILIGTHRMLSADIKFKDLGLLVIDEEQRFGVKHKEKIKQFRSQVDVLTLSATPIPRTLYMSLMNIRDLSVISTPPADRLAIRTRFMKSNDYIIQEAVSREIRRRGQVFVVHNRVETIYEYGNYLKSILPNVKIAVGHGQMSEHELERIMMDFIDAKYDLLLSTTIIESGLDIPRANTIIINNANQFGLAQLYQLRGRVGRSNIQAYAYLLVPPDKILTNIAHERLKILQEFNDLGVGFKIASRDMELRGAGNLLGAEQSGHISSVGLELYTQMIERSIKKIQQKEKAAELEEIKVELGLDVTIPEAYISSTSQRLSLYKQLASAQTEEDLWSIRRSTENRYGHLPTPLIHLFQSGQARIIGYELGLKSIEYKGGKLEVQIGDVQTLNHEKLIAWLQTPNSQLRYIPESTLVLHDVPSKGEAILDHLRQFRQLFEKAIAA